MSDLIKEYSKVLQDIQGIEIELRKTDPLREELSSLRSQERTLISKLFIDDNKIHRADIQFSTGKGLPHFGVIQSFIQWIKNNSEKQWAEWNGRIYRVSDLLQNRMPDMPGHSTDLKD